MVMMFVWGLKISIHGLLPSRRDHVPNPIPITPLSSDSLLMEENATRQSRSTSSAGRKAPPEMEDRLENSKTNSFTLTFSSSV